MSVRFVLGLVLAYGCGAAAASDFAAQLEYGQIDASGAGTPRVSRVIKDANSGQQFAAGFAWIPASDWTVRARYERASIRYDDPSDETCPADADFLFLPAFCQTSILFRAGEITDRVETFEISVERFVRLAESFGIVAGLGFVSSNWKAPDDDEIDRLGACEYGPDIQGVSPIPGCEQVSTVVHDRGWIGNLGVSVALGARWTVELRGHSRSFRYRITRNDVIDRWLAENELPPGREASIRATNVGQDREGSWTWLSLRGQFDVSRDWSAYIQLEGGGSRDWARAVGGLEYRF
ncbi:MAG TPA: hypothetical protein VFL14_12885 [Xanthomonadales bacterium]|nr:hypothetical protein [Xanthomonadales bacterium]